MAVDHMAEVLEAIRNAGYHLEIEGHGMHLEVKVFRNGVLVATNMGRSNVATWDTGRYPFRPPDGVDTA